MTQDRVLEDAAAMFHSRGLPTDRDAANVIDALRVRLKDDRAELEREARGLDDYANEVSSSLTETVLRASASRLRIIARRA